MNPLVSIIIPNYNHALFLKKRLDSVYNQTYPHFEVILLDDASTDKSVEILKTYENHPKTAHLIVNKQNSGSPFKQWKKGVELAKGELIWIAESDDYATPNFLELVSKPLLENKEIGLSYCQSTIVDENNNELYTNTKWTDDLDKDRWLSNYTSNGLDECVNFLLYKNTIPNASAVLFRKSLVTQFPTEFKMLGDWWFWITILLKTNLFFISEPLNFFRTHLKTSRQHNTFNKKKLRIEEGIQIIKHLSIVISKNQLAERKIFHYKWYLKTISILQLLNNFLYPYNFVILPLNYTKIVFLTLKEFNYRIFRKLTYA